MDLVSQLPVTRNNAKSLDSIYYFTGMPCKHGHISARYTNNGSCIECNHLRRQQDYIMNKDKIYAQVKIWNANNRDKIKDAGREAYYAKHEFSKEKARKFYERHSDTIKSKNKEKYWADPEESRLKARTRYNKTPDIFHMYSKKWKKENPAQSIIDKNKRRAKKLSNGGTFTKEDIQNIYEWQKGQCYWCKKVVGKNYHIDHIWPISKGGSNNPENLCISCPSCNHRKHNKTPMEFAGRLF